MEKLKQYLKPYVAYISLTMGIKLLGTVLELLIPFLMEIILDDIVPTRDRRMIFLYGGVMLLCAAGCLGANVLANRMSAVSSGKITKTLRHDLFDRLNRLSARQMDQLTTASAEARLTSDTYNINQLLARTQRLGIRAPIMLIGGIFLMLKMDAVLSLILVAMLPAIALVVWFVTKKSVPMYREEQSVLDRMVRVLQENITGVRVIKALSKTDYEKERFRTVNEDLTRIDQNAGKITALSNPSTSLILNFGLTLVVLVGAFRVNRGLCKTGVIIAFLQFFVMISNAMLGITRIFVMWSKGEASAHRVADILSMPEDMQSTQGRTPLTDRNTPHIEFRDVTFSYTGIGANLSHLSFCLRHGESLGIIGETGAGKSTILNLLMRIYDVQSGSILIDGRDIRSMTSEELRGRFGVVFQNDFLMEGTIADNIRFFRDIDDEALAQAAEYAQASEYIAKKEKGFGHMVAVRGNNISGGQKQRLLIARALAASPEILLLDDASSALDYQTDALFRRSLHAHFQQTTTILVAQRISSICGCTHIMVLKEGEVIGYGTHEELMASCEEYRTIAQSQMGAGEV